MDGTRRGVEPRREAPEVVEAEEAPLAVQRDNLVKEARLIESEEAKQSLRVLSGAAQLECARELDLANGNTCALESLHSVGNIFMFDGEMARVVADPDVSADLLRAASTINRFDARGESPEAILKPLDGFGCRLKDAQRFGLHTKLDAASRIRLE